MQRVLSRWRVLGFLAAGLAVGGLVLLLRPSPARTADQGHADEAAVARTRTTVRMLDDLYKSSVVHITKTYVKARERTPAAVTVKQVFRDMEAKGWHSARLVDATGKPVNRSNRPRAGFEKRAVDQLKAGKPYYDEVGYKNNEPVLRAATAVPVVMDQCIACHPHTHTGELMGAIVYEIPIR